MKRDHECSFRGNYKDSILDITCSPFVQEDLLEFDERRIYLQGEISGIDFEDKYIDEKITVARIVRLIMRYNREDEDVPISERQPIKLYINSPGGSAYEGFALISAIELSKTPVYTYNIGQWSSMAFLIGIAGHKRFSMPSMVFLMHDGSEFIFGSASKVQDQAKFQEKYEQNVIKTHILRHSNMKPTDYEILNRVEYYMLPEDALSHGFIDEIVTDMDQLL